MRSFILFCTFLSFLIFLILSCHNNNDEKNVSADSTITKLTDSISRKIDDLSVKISAEPLNSQLYFFRAEQYFLNNNLDAARTDIYRAITIDSSNSDYYVLLGDISFVMGKASVASNAFEKSVSLNPQNEKGLLKQAELALYLRDYKKVYEKCNTVLELNTENAKAFFIKGIAKKETGDTLAAIKDFLTTIDKDPDYYHAFMQLGILYSTKKKPIAVDYLNNALRLNPKSIEAYYALGMYFQETGDFNKAFEAYSAILSIDANYKYAHYNNGYIHYQYLNNASEAAKHFSNAITSDPKYPEAWYMRGLCREKLGDVTNAIADYKKAIELREGYDKAIMGLNRVEKLMK